MSSTTFGDAAPHAPGLQDILRTGEGPLNIASKVNNKHPLESRVANWEETQYETKLEMYRRIFGAGEPIKRTMDLQIIEATDFRPLAVGGPSNLHKDILLNKDTSVDWEDIYKDGFETSNHMKDFHAEMEKKLGM